MDLMMFSGIVSVALFMAFMRILEVDTVSPYDRRFGFDRATDQTEDTDDGQA